LCTFAPLAFTNEEKCLTMAFFCGVIRVLDGDTKIYEGPSFFRCELKECRKLVTSGYIEQHGTCYCGARRLRDAVLLTPEEEEALRRGDYPLVEWEREFVRAEIERAHETADRDTGL
jgi:hypothetical protein